MQQCNGNSLYIRSTYAVAVMPALTFDVVPAGFLSPQDSFSFNYAKHDVIVCFADCCNLVCSVALFCCFGYVMGGLRCGGGGGI